MLYILDTDHISLWLARSAAGYYKPVTCRCGQSGCHHYYCSGTGARAFGAEPPRPYRKGSGRAFTSLQNSIAVYQTVQVLPYNDEAATKFEQLRQQKIRICAQDLRIAAIVLSHQATLITRNTRDFSRVPDLSLADWST